ncbi:MAG: DUF3800 domain-containing protein [Bacilli bacterium]|nr:DUF3800 domain-containing protein [Bacilli bacterium]
MNSKIEINVYADESCHLEHDNVEFMVLGCIYCLKKDKNYISKKMKEIKKEYGLNSMTEIKWTKVSNNKIEMYKKMIDLVYDSNLSFRGWIAHDKQSLDNDLFHQTYDDWYYKMYYYLFNYIINESIINYNLYLDIKDTRSSIKNEKLKQILTHYNIYNINKVQAIRSDEVQLIQLADLIIGAISYKLRGLETSTAKLEIVNYIESKFGVNLLINSSSNQKKFNIFHWRSQK